MISKEKFLDDIKYKIIPEIKKIEPKYKRFYRIVVKIIPTLSVVAFFFSLYQTIIHTNMRDPYAPIYLFGAFFSLAVLNIFCLVKFSEWTDKCIEKFKPNIFSLLDVKLQQEDETAIRDLIKLGLFPLSRCRHIDESFIVYGTKYPTSVQEIVLERRSGKHTRTVFCGPVITFHQPFLPDVPILILDKKIKTNRLKLELTTSFCSKVEKRDLNWKEIKLNDKKVSQNYAVFSASNGDVQRILSPDFFKQIQKIKDIYGAPANVLFYQKKIIVAIHIRRDMFSAFNYENFSDLKVYSSFYDDIKAIHTLEKTICDKIVF